jgi:hypothetical protein
MLNLGKFFILNIAIFLISELFATVVISTDEKEITRGEQVKIKISVSGQNIKFPNITKLGGYEIEGQSQSHSRQIINGNISESYDLYFLISPKKDVKIAPIKVEIDGVVEISNELNIKVVEPKYDPNDPFTLRIVANKTKIFVGEPLLVTVEYKEDESKDVIDRKYSPPTGDNLWLKTQSEIETIKKDKYSFTSISYVFTPQKAGNITVDSASMKIGMRHTRKDSWGFFFESIKWKNIISNQLDLEVLPLPKQEKLIGDFKISATVDKNEVESNEAVNLTIEIQGTGNVEDIQKFEFKTDNAVLFTEKPEVKNLIKNNEYLGTFKQKIAIIPNKSLDIPSFELRYFDPNDSAIYSIKTEPIHITLKQSNKLYNDKFYIEKAQDLNTSDDINQNNQVNFLFLILAFITGSIFTLVIIFNPVKYLKNSFQRSKIFKSDRKILMKLLPFVSKNSFIFEIANKISFKLYTNKNVELEKKELKEALKQSDQINRESSKK